MIRNSLAQSADKFQDPRGEQLDIQRSLSDQGGLQSCSRLPYTECTAPHGTLFGGITAVQYTVCSPCKVRCTAGWCLDISVLLGNMVCGVP